MATGQSIYWKLWNENNPNDQIVSGDGCCIHHINGDHNDNRIENLQKMGIGEHTSLHMTGENHHYYGVTGPDNPHYGKEVSEETRERLRKAQTGKTYSEESKNKMSESYKGQKAWNKGIPMSEEQKKKVSESKKGCVSHMKGKKHSEETRRKISAANKGRIPWNKGRKKNAS